MPGSGLGPRSREGAADLWTSAFASTPVRHSSQASQDAESSRGGVSETDLEGSINDEDLIASRVPMPNQEEEEKEERELIASQGARSPTPVDPNDYFEDDEEEVETPIVSLAGPLATPRGLDSAKALAAQLEQGEIDDLIRGHKSKASHSRAVSLPPSSSQEIKKKPGAIVTIRERSETVNRDVEAVGIRKSIPLCPTEWTKVNKRYSSNTVIKTAEEKKIKLGPDHQNGVKASYWKEFVFELDVLPHLVEAVKTDGAESFSLNELKHVLNLRASWASGHFTTPEQVHTFILKSRGWAVAFAIFVSPGRMNSFYVVARFDGGSQKESLHNPPFLLSLVELLKTSNMYARFFNERQGHELNLVLVPFSSSLFSMGAKGKTPQILHSRILRDMTPFFPYMERDYHGCALVRMVDHLPTAGAGSIYYEIADLKLMKRYPDAKHPMEGKRRVKENPMKHYRTLSTSPSIEVSVRKETFRPLCDIQYSYQAFMEAPDGDVKSSAKTLLPPKRAVLNFAVEGRIVHVFRAHADDGHTHVSDLTLEEKRDILKDREVTMPDGKVKKRRGGSVFDFVSRQQKEDDHMQAESIGFLWRALRQEGVIGPVEAVILYCQPFEQYDADMIQRWSRDELMGRILEQEFPSSTVHFFMDSSGREIRSSKKNYVRVFYLKDRDYRGMLERTYATIAEKMKAAIFED